MAEKKKQHYVPKFYMRMFLFDNTSFYLYNLSSKKNIGLVPYKSQCYKNFFYGQNVILENKLSALELKWRDAMLAFLDHNYSKGTIKLLKEFSLYQLRRTTNFYNQEKKAHQKLIQEYIETHLAGKNQLSASNIEMAKNISIEKADAMISPEIILDTVDNLLEQIEDLAFLHIHFKTNKKLISSDNPILPLNQYIQNNRGVGIIGYAMLFTISPTDACLFYDAKFYPKYANKYYVELNDQSIVNHINALLYATAEEIIYSSEPIDNTILSSNNNILRKQNSETNNVSNIGIPTNKMIVINNCAVYNHFNFIFLKIRDEFSKIKKCFRTPVPRIYDHGYDEKLLHEYTLLPDILSLNKTNQINDKYISDYKKSHEKYHHLIKKYWKDEL